MNAGEVGSAGDTSGGFRIAGDRLLFTPTNPLVFSPAGVGNDFGAGHSDPHAGAFRSAPSIFVQHGSGAGPQTEQDTASAGAARGDQQPSRRTTVPVKKAAPRGEDPLVRVVSRHREFQRGLDHPKIDREAFEATHADRRRMREIIFQGLALVLTISQWAWTPRFG